MDEIKHYRSEDGRHLFTFRFIDQGSHIDIYCLRRPSLRGQDPDPHKTHLFASGKICFIAGREPEDQERAEELAKQWSEYYVEYRRTGVAQS